MKMSSERPVAQFGRAPVSKTGGWGFETLLACQVGEGLPIFHAESEGGERFVAGAGGEAETMSWLRDRVERFRVFVGDVVAETRKSTWPERQELLESTVVVIVSVLILSVFVGVSDKVLVSLVKVLVP